MALDSKAHRGFTSNGRSNSVTIFDLKSLRKLGEVPVGEGPDAIIFDPASRRVFTFNGQGRSATAIDAATGQVLATLPLPGRPESAVSDGRGHLYNNIEDKNEVAVINAKTLQVEHLWPLGEGEEPSGIAMDRGSRRLFVVCGNQKLVVLDADDGHVVATLAIGNGPDGCAFDPASHLIFSSNGEDGTLTILREAEPNRYETVGTIATQPGARTMALDEKTHAVYTFAGKVAPDRGTRAANSAGGPGRRRGYVPGSLAVLILKP